MRRLVLTEYQTGDRVAIKRSNSFCGQNFDDWVYAAVKTPAINDDGVMTVITHSGVELYVTSHRVGRLVESSDVEVIQEESTNAPGTTTVQLTEFQRTLITLLAVDKQEHLLKHVYFHDGQNNQETARKATHVLIEELFQLIRTINPDSLATVAFPDP